MRAAHAALAEIGFKVGLLRHGIQREVFICNLATNAKKILRTGKEPPELTSLLTAKDVAQLAIKRWMIPRSKRRPEYKDWNAHDLSRLFESQCRRQISEELERRKIVGHSLL